MFKLSMVLGLTVLMSMPSFAQVEKTARAESGSGNGSLSRDVLEFETQLSDAQLSIVSLEEAFEDFKKNLKTLSEIKVPDYSSASEEFWTKLTESDRNLLLKIDKDLIENVELQNIMIDHAKYTVSTTQAIINALAKELPHYEERGAAKAFNKILSQKKVNLQNELRKILGEAFTGLESPLGRCLGSFVPCYQEEMLTCQSALCVDLITNRYLSYVNSLEAVSELKINILNIKNKSFYKATLYNPYDGANYAKNVRQYKKDIKARSIHSLSVINDRAISVNNN